MRGRRDRTRLGGRTPRPKEDVMRQFELVIVGGGLASARAIKAYREAGARERWRFFERRHSSVQPAPAVEGLPSGRDRRGALRRRRSPLCRQRRRRPTWDFGVRRYPSGALADHAARTTLRLRAAADRHRRAAPALERSRNGARRRVHAALARRLSLDRRPRARREPRPPSSWRLHRHGGGCFPAAARPSGGADPPRQRLVRPARLT